MNTPVLTTGGTTEQENPGLIRILYGTKSVRMPLNEQGEGAALQYLFIDVVWWTKGMAMMPHKKIDRLTPEQESRFAELKKEWMAIGLSTEPANRPKAEVAINEIYRIAGLQPPKKIMWCGSPMAQGLAQAIICNPKFPDSVAKSVWASIKNRSGDGIQDDVKASFSTSVRIVDSVGVRRNIMAGLKTSLEESMRSYAQNISNSMREKVSECVWECVLECIWKGIEVAIKTHNASYGIAQSINDGIKGSIESSIGVGVKHKVWNDARDVAWNSIADSVGGRVRTTVWDTLWSGIQDNVWDKVAVSAINCIKEHAFDSVKASGYGQYDAYWLAFYTYFRDVGGLASETESLRGLIDLAQSAGWFLPYEHICWVAERPCVLSLDEKGRLHSSSGPALVYPDGWSIHALHGTRVSVNEMAGNKLAAVD